MVSSAFSLTGPEALNTSTFLVCRFARSPVVAGVVAVVAGVTTGVLGSGRLRLVADGAIGAAVASFMGASEGAATAAAAATIGVAALGEAALAAGIAALGEATATGEVGLVLGD